MASEVKEIVIHTDVRDAQHSFPDPDQDQFELIVGNGFAASFRVRPFRRRQGATVDLPVVGQRQGIELSKDSWNHITGKTLLQMRAQLRRDQVVFGFRDDVGYQSPLTRPVFTNDYDGTFHTRMSGQGRFDLSQFNAEASNLYLVIAASEELDVSIRKVARHIAGAIHPGIGILDEGIGNEPFCGAVRLLQVPRGDPIARNVQFPDHAHRQQLALRVENIHLAVGDRSANRNAGGWRILPGVLGKAQRERTDRCLRWAVVIQNFAASAQVLNRLQQLGCKSFSSQYQVLPRKYLILGG